MELQVREDNRNGKPPLLQACGRHIVAAIETIQTLDKRSRLAKGRGRRMALTSFCLLLCVLMLMPLPCCPAAPPSPDANALVRKMVAAYQAATTIQETSEAKMVEPGKGEYIQSNTLKYKRPAMLALETVDPDLGTLATYVNGSTITIFSGKQNVYTKRTASPNLARNLTVIGAASTELVHVTPTQMLNPISFLLAKGGMPEEAQAFRYVGVKMVEGRKTYMLIAQASTVWLKQIMPFAKPERRDINLYIDVQTNLLAKAAIAVTYQATLPAVSGEPSKIVRGGFAFEETHRGTILNAPIVDATFSFRPPKGATEIFQEHR
jgi:outer membrane lipoprotein-sorting protein